MENQIGFSRWPPLPRKLWKCYYFASSEAEWGKSKDIQSVCLKENECLCCSCTTRNLESRRPSLTLFITLWLESCSKFLAVFAAFADSPLSVCLCRKTSSCPNVQSRVRWTNVAGKRWNQTMNEQLKRSTSATLALSLVHWALHLSCKWGFLWAPLIIQAHDWGLCCEARSQAHVTGGHHHAPWAEINIRAEVRGAIQFEIGLLLTRNQS